LAQLKNDRGKPKRYTVRRKIRRLSTRQISLVILLAALLRALVELASAILALIG
jgi:hypothetical protein